MIKKYLKKIFEIINSGKEPTKIHNKYKEKNTRSEVLLHNLMSETMHAFDYEEDWAKYLKLEIGMTEEELSYMKSKYNYPDMPKKEE